MSNKPFISIIMPTLNRAEYLPFAIQSVLNQTFEDFELIVSNNSSTDNTDEVVGSFEDVRIKYVKTDKLLPMSDSWEFALSHARGEYITFLGDDDAHAAIYLSSLEKIINAHKAEIVSCKMSHYSYFDTVESGRKIASNSLIVPSYTGELYIHESSQAIKHFFSIAGLTASPLNKPCNMPQLINSVYSKSVISKVKKRLSHFIPKMLLGDLYLAVTALNFTDKYHFWDYPLSIHGTSRESLTGGKTNAKEVMEYYKKYMEDSQFIHSPFKFVTSNNMRAESFLQAKTDLGEDLNFIDLEWRQYFLNCHFDILSLDAIGIDISEMLENYYSLIEKEDNDLFHELTSRTSRIRTKVKQSLRKKLRLSSIANLVRKFQHLNYSLVSGEKIGFKDITECAKLMDESFLATYKEQV